MIRHNGYPTTIRRVPPVSVQERAYHKLIPKNHEQVRAFVAEQVAIGHRWKRRNMSAKELQSTTHPMVAFNVFHHTGRTISRRVLNIAVRHGCTVIQVCLQLFASHKIRLSALEVVESVEKHDDLGIDAAGTIFAMGGAK